MSLVAKRDIQPGEEIFTSYNYDVQKAPIWYQVNFISNSAKNQGQENLGMWAESSSPEPERFFGRKESFVPNSPSPTPNTFQKASLIFSQRRPYGLVPV